MTVRVDWRGSVSLLGTTLKWFAVPLLAPLGVALRYGEALVPWLATIAVTVAVGAAMERLSQDRDIGQREAYLVVVLIWLFVAVVGALPLYLDGSGVFSAPVNALFEAMSGITTTGATVIQDFSVHSRAVLLWRQLLQWLGGLGILVLATAVLSRLSIGGARLMETETQYQNVQRLTPQIVTTAKLLWALYVGLTVLAVAVLFGLHLLGLAPEMTLFDAVAHALTSVATAGFSPRSESVGAFSPAVQWAVIPFMFVGAVNFILLYYLLQGDARRLKDSEEFRFYAAVVVIFGGLIAALLATSASPDVPGTSGGTIRHALFQTVSIITTTGYASVDFNLWPSSTRYLLFLAMFLGGMAGSTTCSIKALRWLIVLKGFRRDLFTAIHPEAVRPVRLSGNTVEESAITDVYAYTMLSLLLFFVATVLIAVDSARTGVDVTEFEAMTAAAATFLNIGPAFGIAGPFETYANFSRSSRWLMTVLMWVGRIEIIPVLVVLTPAYWES